MKRIITVITAMCLLNSQMAFAFQMSAEHVDEIIKSEMMLLTADIAAQPESEQREYAIERLSTIAENFRNLPEQIAAKTVLPANAVAQANELAEFFQAYSEAMINDASINPIEAVTALNQDYQTAMGAAGAVVACFGILFGSIALLGIFGRGNFLK